MTTQPYTLVSAADMSADVTSNAIQVTGIESVSISAVYTGAPVGVIKLQTTLDQVTWVDVADSSFAISSAGIFIWDYTVTAVPYLRVAYVATSGTGALTVQVFKK